MSSVQNTLSTANNLINEDKKDTIKTTVEKVQEDMSDSTEEDEQDYDELI